MATYRWDPSEYQRHSEAQRLWARELIEKLPLLGDERVLDIGCGDGKVTEELAARVPRGSVLGIDSSLSMVEFARSRFPAERFVNLRFQQVDARSLPFEGEFTVAFSNAALHWIREPHEAVMRGLARSLTPGGRLLLQMGGRGNAGGVIAVLDEAMAREPWRAGFSGFECPYGFHGPQRYRRWLNEAGLEPKRVELLPKDMAHEGRSGLAGWLRTTWQPYLDRVPERQREAFLTEVVDHYVERFPVDGRGQIHVAMVRLEVEAVKPRG